MKTNSKIPVTKQGTKNILSVNEPVKNHMTTPEPLPYNSENPRFYGLLPLMWFSGGIIVLMIIAKLIMDWLAKS